MGYLGGQLGYGFQTLLKKSISIGCVYKIAHRQVFESSGFAKGRRMSAQNYEVAALAAAWFGSGFTTTPVKEKLLLYYINGPRKQLIQVDIILHGISHFGLPRQMSLPK